MVLNGRPLADYGSEVEAGPRARRSSGVPLSGGERSLVAVAFCVFVHRPASPFYTGTRSRPPWTKSIWAVLEIYTALRANSQCC